MQPSLPQRDACADAALIRKIVAKPLRLSSGRLCELRRFDHSCRAAHGCWKRGVLGDRPLPGRDFLAFGKRLPFHPRPAFYDRTIGKVWLP